MKKRFKRIILFVLALVVVVVPSAQSGDVLDFLPEVILTRSVLLAEPFIITELEVCEGFDTETPIPDHILIDENGEFRSADEVEQIVIDINCLTQAVQVTDDAEQSRINTFRFVDILNGEAVEFQNGIVIDGTKQSVRVALALPMLLLFNFDLVGGFLSFGLLGDEPCETLREWALSANSLELRWVSLFTLVVEANPENVMARRCSQPVDGTEDELISLTQANDLDAAVQWVLNDILALETEFGEEPDTADLPEIQIRIEAIKLLILENTSKYPLLTLAYSLPLFSLESAVLLLGE